MDILTKDEIGAVLKKARESAGMTQTQVAKMIGKSQQVIGNWETGYAQPDANTLFVLCDIYGISIDDSFGSGKKVRVTPTEMAHIKKYRDLDGHGKDVVDTILDKEYDRCLEARKRQADASGQVPRLVSFIVYDDPAAAGSPLDATSSYTRIDFQEDAVPAEADFGVRISGDSMEPAIPDGSVAFVRRSRTAANGDTIIAWIDGEGMVCKRAVCNGEQLVKLQSDNPAYADIDGHRLNGLVIYGKVVGSILC